MMILIQIVTALAIGAYVVLSKDTQPDATPRGQFSIRPIISSIATVVQPPTPSNTIATGRESRSEAAR